MCAQSGKCLRKTIRMSPRDGAWSPSDTIAGARDPDLVRRENSATAASPAGEHVPAEQAALQSTPQTSGHPLALGANPASSGIASSSNSSERAELLNTVRALSHAIQYPTLTQDHSRVLPSPSGNASASSAPFSETDSEEATLPAVSSPMLITDFARPLQPLLFDSDESALPSPVAAGRSIEVSMLDEWPTSAERLLPVPSRPHVESGPSFREYYTASDHSDSLQSLHTPNASQASQLATRLYQPSTTGRGFQIELQGRRVPRALSHIPTAASSLGLSSDASNPTESRQANSLVSDTIAHVGSEERRSDQTGVPQHAPDLHYVLANEGTGARDQYMTIFQRHASLDYAFVHADYSIPFDSHTESLSVTGPLPRPIPGTEGTADGPVTVVRTPKPRIGPSFDIRAVLEPQPLALKKTTSLDTFVNDTEGGLWQMSPRSSHPQTSPVNAELLSPENVAWALRQCQNEFSMFLDFYSLTRVIDLSNLEYVSDCNKNLECGICREPLVQPLTTQCHHTFCRECLGRAIRPRRICPCCRHYLTRPVMVPNKIVIDMLDEMKVYCLLRSRGCQEILARSDIAKHMMHDCGYLLVACPIKTCTILLPRKDFRDGICRHKMTQCAHCKLFSCPEVDLAAHIEGTCPEYKITCSECSQLVPRKAFDDHVEECVKPCKAGAYGCAFTGRDDARVEHEAACPLATLVPWLKGQEQIMRSLEELLRRSNP